VLRIAFASVTYIVTSATRMLTIALVSVLAGAAASPAARVVRRRRPGARLAPHLVSHPEQQDVLAVAGAAHGDPGMLIFGLVLSIALMAVAANLVANLIERHRWLAYLGVAVVAYVALDMIWRGMTEVMNAAAGW
jgi:hypothetical protein